jgi:site-specific recombinase XerD
MRDLAARRRTVGPLDISRVRTAFDGYLTEERALSKASKVSYWFITRRFLTELRRSRRGFDPAALRPSHITAYLMRHAAEVSTRRLQTMASGLRSFLRFLFRQGWTEADLSTSVLTARSWRHAALPRYLAPDDVERLVQSCDLSTAIGRRDHAILLLLARLGLRATEVVALGLDDVDWRAGEVLIRGKGLVLDRLPLPRDVGAALAKYLRHDRRGPTRRVFVRTAGEAVPFVDGQPINDVLKRALARTGVRMPAKWVGSHVFRHSLATTMIRRGASLREIGDVLRHRSVNTTTIYAKLDVEALRSIAKPWPLVVGGRR